MGRKAKTRPPPTRWRRSPMTSNRQNPPVEFTPGMGWLRRNPASDLQFLLRRRQGLEPRTR